MDIQSYSIGKTAGVIAGHGGLDRHGGGCIARRELQTIDLPVPPDIGGGDTSLPAILVLNIRDVVGAVREGYIPHENPFGFNFTHDATVINGNVRTRG
jgi:hypothetical protein